MMLRTRCGVFTCVLAALAFSCVTAVVDPTIMWKNCDGPADHPSVGEGNYYNLCIEGHLFENERHAWTFTKTSIKESVFDTCTFAHTPQKKMDLTEATWTNVRFTKTRFASFTNDPVVFESTLLENVMFDGVIFDTTSNIVFSNFEFRNVTFLNCEFQSNVRFELGQMNEVYFNNTSFRRSPDTIAASGDNRALFNGLTIRKVFFSECEFVNPVNFQAANVADAHFNDTNFNEFWCHSVPLSDDTAPASFASFNDTIFYNVQFRESVQCNGITWRGMHFESVRFLHDGIFSNSRILNMVFKRVLAKPKDQSCRTLDFSDTYIKRKLIQDVNASCKADFSGGEVEQVFFKKFNAARPNFENTVFTDQEFIDGVCCTSACEQLGCKCNTTDVSGECPAGSKNVLLGDDAACFAGHSTVSLADGSSVPMTSLRTSDRISIGGGEHSDVYLFGHKNAEASTPFVAITSAKQGESASVKPLLISPGHYLYVNGKLSTAQSVAVGDRLRGADMEDTMVVMDVSRQVHKGAFAPTTIHGDLVVDGIVVSSYTDALHPHTAHRLLKPARFLYTTPLRALVTRTSTVMHTESLAWLARSLGLSEGPETIDDL